MRHYIGRVYDVNATTINQLAEEIESLRSDLEFVNEQVNLVHLQNDDLNEKLQAALEREAYLIKTITFIATTPTFTKNILAAHDEMTAAAFEALEVNTKARGNK